MNRNHVYRRTVRDTNTSSRELTMLGLIFLTPLEIIGAFVGGVLGILGLGQLGNKNRKKGGKRPPPPKKRRRK